MTSDRDKDLAGVVWLLVREVETMVPRGPVRDSIVRAGHLAFVRLNPHEYNSVPDCGWEAERECVGCGRRWDEHTAPGRACDHTTSGRFHPYQPTT